MTERIMSKRTNSRDGI